MSKVRKFFRNHVLPAFLRLLVTIIVITLIIYVSIWLTYYASNRGTTTWQGIDLNWSYVPVGLVPVDLAYTNWTILLDGHSQTDISDGVLTPEQNVIWHISNGYNAMILSDHNDVQGGTEAQQIARERYDDKIKVIVAQEYSSCRIHMNLVGINQTIPSVAWPSDEELQAVINQTHALGGYVSVNHIPWSWYSLSDTFSLQDLYDWGVDYVEIVNGNTFDYQSYVFAKSKGMGVVTGTDMHYPNRGVNGWTAMIANFTEEAIFEALKNRKTGIIYNAIDSPYAVGPIVKTSTSLLDPFFRIGDLFNGYYVTETSMWSFNHAYCGTNKVVLQWKLIALMVGWMFAIFLFLEIVGQSFAAFYRRYLKRCCKGKKRSAYEHIDLGETIHLMSRNDTAMSQ